MEVQNPKKIPLILIKNLLTFQPTSLKWVAEEDSHLLGSFIILFWGGNGFPIPFKLCGFCSLNLES